MVGNCLQIAREHKLNSWLFLWKWRQNKTVFLMRAFLNLVRLISTLDSLTISKIIKSLDAFQFRIPRFSNEGIIRSKWWILSVSDLHQNNGSISRVSIKLETFTGTVSIFKKDIECCPTSNFFQRKLLQRIFLNKF